jgi:transcriptional regulator with XRE-family HTH domain
MEKQLVPNTLREHRKRAGLKQIEVAQKLGLKSSDRISHWEKGQAMPNVGNLFKLAELYKVQPAELYSPALPI